MINEKQTKNQLKQIIDEYDLNIEVNEELIQALTHSSYANEHDNKQGHNERLEFLGDAVLGLGVAEFLYTEFPLLDEGTMTKTRSVYVCEPANKNYALKLGLDKILLLGKGEEASGGRSRTRNLNCCFEAFLGAIYLSGGKSEVEKILERIVYPTILEGEGDTPFTDYKSKLQENLQAESREAIEYKVVNEVGPAHNKTFTVKVYHEGLMLGEGMGKSKKEAEQMAAKSALEKMVK